MTVRELIDIAEEDIIEFYFEGWGGEPVITLHGTDVNMGNDYSDILTKDFLKTEVLGIKCGEGCGLAVLVGEIE